MPSFTAQLKLLLSQTTNFLAYSCIKSVASKLLLQIEEVQQKDENELANKENLQEMKKIHKVTIGHLVPGNCNFKRR